ncbi:MAG: PepSY domain-containing protein, partial [Arenicella sp.]|nr:PepSY domain-containing protein [Arenicella sp.]
MSIKLFHRYIGLLLCLIMLSISITGVILVWKKEYLWLSVDGARQVADPNMLAKAIENIEASYDDGEVTFIQLYSEDLSIHKVFLSDRRYAWHNQRGDKVQVWSGNQRWEDFFLDLHHRFLLGNKIGLNIAGFGGLLALPLLVLGFILWWPRRRLLSLG